MILYSIQELIYRKNLLKSLSYRQQFRFQPLDADLNGLPSDEGVLHLLSAKGSRHITLKQHAFLRDGSPVLAKLTDMRAAYHPSEQVIDIVSCQRAVCHHLVRQAVVPALQLFLLPQFLQIHQSEGLPGVFSFNLVKQLQRFSVNGWLHQQIKLLCIQIAFHRAAPCIFPVGNFQHIGQDLDFRLSSRFFQFFCQALLQIQKSVRIILDIPAQPRERRLHFRLLFPQLLSLHSKCKGCFSHRL